MKEYYDERKYTESTSKIAASMGYILGDEDNI